jgi:hypothetical protein
MATAKTTKQCSVLHIRFIEYNAYYSYTKSKYILVQFMTGKFFIIRAKKLRHSKATSSISNEVELKILPNIGLFYVYKWY